MSEREFYVRIDRELVKVSKEVYQEYYRGERKERYIMEDLKKESITIDSETGRVTIRSSREDSYERLLESGWQFETMESMEEQMIRSVVLKQALQKLTLEEQKLIEEIYFSQKTERQASDALHMAKTTLRRRHHKALKKLRKLLEENF